MKKRTIWFIMLGFILLSFLLNIGLRKKMLKGTWLGKSKKGEEVALSIQGDRFIWINSKSVDTLLWAFPKENTPGAIVLKRGEKSQVVFAQLPTFDLLDVMIDTMPAAGSFSKDTFIKMGRYSFNRVSNNEYYEILHKWGHTNGDE